MLVMLYQKTPEPLLDLLQWKYDVWEEGWEESSFCPEKKLSNVATTTELFLFKYLQMHLEGGNRSSICVSRMAV